MNRKYLVMGGNGWGKASTIAEAFKNCLNNVPTYQKTLELKRKHKGKPVFYVANVPADAFVDDMGTICWTSGEQETHAIGYIDFYGKLVKSPDHHPKVEGDVHAL